MIVQNSQSTSKLFEEGQQEPDRKWDNKYGHAPPRLKK
jgi:hypothetical protein